MGINCDDIWGRAFLEECTVRAKALRRVSGCVSGIHQAGMAGVLVWSVSHCTDIY